MDLASRRDVLVLIGETGIERSDVANPLRAKPFIVGCKDCRLRFRLGMCHRAGACRNQDRSRDHGRQDCETGHLQITPCK